MKRFLLFIFFYLLTRTIFATGAVIKVLDKKNNQPVPYVNICFEGLETHDKYYKTTTKDGVANNPVTEKSKIVILYVGYKTVTDTILPNESRTFYLEQKTLNIDQVVCTGTFIPTPKDKSIYDVKVISSEELKQQGATNISDVFQTRPNIRMTYDQSLGCQIEMLGMEGNNVKVMIDGVSVLGRLDGNIDLGQINTENIDHVEIVEGPMSVVYGNNALAGTINIITKNGSKTKTEAKIGTQAESVGKYSGSLFLSKPLGNQTLSMNAFASYFNGVDFDGETRSQDWRPTSNYQAGLNYKWEKNKWSIDARANGYYGSLLIKSDIAQNYMVYDTYYYTRRLSTSAEASGHFDKDHFIKILGSYSFYDRASQEYDKDLTTLEGTWQDKETSQNFKNGNCRIIYGQNIPGLNTELQSGIDLNYDYMGGPRIDTTTYQSIGDYAAFLNLKYKLNEKTDIQPGIRYAYNTAFLSPLVYSFNLKYSITSKISWRASVAKGFRAPSLKELYYDFVNSSHDIHGNPDLKAEYSHNINTSLLYAASSSLSIKVSGYYNNLKNKIELVENTSVSSNYYDYENIEKYESIGGEIGLVLHPVKNLQINIGGTITGRYNEYSEENSSRKFNYSPDLFGSVLYSEPHSKIQCSIDYKYNGKRPYLYTDDDDTIQEGEEDPYHFMNISVNRNFFGNHLKTSVGIRNLFNVTSVRSVGANTSAHSSSNSTAITYGRSFFVQASYNF